MKYWRNGKVGKPPLSMALFRFLWLVPFVPILTLYIASRQRGGNSFLEYLTSNWQDSLSVSLVIGLILWFITVFVQLRPTLIKNEKNLKILKYGLFATTIELENIKNIRLSNLGVIGSLWDFKTNVNLGFREFVFLGKANKIELLEFFAGTKIEIV